MIERATGGADDSRSATLRFLGNLLEDAPGFGCIVLVASVRHASILGIWIGHPYHNLFFPCDLMLILASSIANRGIAMPAQRSLRSFLPAILVLLLPLLS